MSKPSDSVRYDYNANPQGLSRSGENFNINYKYLSEIVVGQFKNTSIQVLKILEVGCGGGRNLAYLKSRFGSNVDVFGVDISHSAIEYAKKNIIGSFEVSRAEVIPFSDNFDIIIFNDILEHLDSKEDAQASISSAHKLLRSGGTMYICLPIELNFFTLTWLFSKFQMTKLLTYKFFGHTFQLKQLEARSLLGGLLPYKTYYSAHFLTHIQFLVFYYTPKFIINCIFGERHRNYSDSHIIQNRDSRSSFTSFFLLVSHHTLLGILKPIQFFTYCESLILKKIKFGAQNIHFFIRK